MVILLLVRESQPPPPPRIMAFLLICTVSFRRLWAGAIVKRLDDLPSKEIPAGQWLNRAAMSADSVFAVFDVIKKNKKRERENAL